MKLAMVIVCLGAIAAGVVHFRRERTILRNEVQRLEDQQVVLRRTLWDQQVRLALLVAPAGIRRRAKEFGLPMSDQVRLPQGPGGSTAGAPTPRHR
jgi:hypothetical protein